MFIAPNFWLITTNHDVYNIVRHVAGVDIVINIDCWIGTDSILLLEVILGDHAVVRAVALW
jgi:acetyltransferase-like isoleucine patch superfamily enzyme